MNYVVALAKLFVLDDAVLVLLLLLLLVLRLSYGFPMFAFFLNMEIPGS